LKGYTVVLVSIVNCIVPQHPAIGERLLFYHCSLFSATVRRLPMQFHCQSEAIWNEDSLSLRIGWI
jgi:hypothetical protein